MVISLVPMAVFANGNASPVQIEVKNAQNGNTQYKVGDGEWMDLNNSQVWDIDGISNGDTVTVRAIPNSEQELDGAEFRVNSMTEFIDNTALQTESGWSFTYTEGSIYHVCIEYRNGSDPEPRPEPDDEPVHDGYEGVEKTASITVTGKADIYINDSRMVNGNDGDRFDNVNYHYDGNGYVDFYFNCFITERIYTLMINGVNYYNNLPAPSKEGGKEALLAACKGQLYEFKITVPYSENGYEIESYVKWLDDDDKDYMVVGNFLWTYVDQNQGDDYIDHGRMELLVVNYGGRDYSPDDLNNPDTAFDWEQNENGGGAVLPVGAVVTVKLIPDYGYQLTSFGINGGSFGTGDEQSIFTFEIKSGNAHLGAHFTPVEDKVTSSSDTVTSGSIKLESALPGGSAQLEISDTENELSDEKLDAFEDAAGNYTITDYLNLDLYNVYYKGSTDTDDVWKNGVNTLDNDATISVSLADSTLAGTVDSSNIVIIHNIHDGEDFETIPIDSYDSKTNTITFKTDSFSTYAIATTSSNKNTIGDSVDTSEPTDSKSPQTGDNSNLALWFALLFVSGTGVLGISVYLKKKKQY